MAEFTQDEIKELVAFYNTDLGKKLAEKQLSLTQKAMMFGQTWGMEVQALPKNIINKPMAIAYCPFHKVLKQ